MGVGELDCVVDVGLGVRGVVVGGCGVGCPGVVCGDEGAGAVDELGGRGVVEVRGMVMRGGICGLCAGAGLGKSVMDPCAFAEFPPGTGRVRVSVVPGCVGVPVAVGVLITGGCSLTVVWG